MKTIKDYLRQSANESLYRPTFKLVNTDVLTSIEYSYTVDSYKDTLVYLPEDIAELTPQEFLSYLALGLIKTNLYASNFYQEFFINYMQGLINNENT